MRERASGRKRWLKTGAEGSARGYHSRKRARGKQQDRLLQRTTFQSIFRRKALAEQREPLI